MLYKQIKKLITYFLFLFLLFSGTDAFGMGISPGSMIFNDIINGQKKEVKMIIMRSLDQTTDSRIHVSAIGEAARFVSFPNNDILVKPEEQQVPYTFFLHPVGAAEGNHTAVVMFSESPVGSNSKQSGSAISVGVGAKITFTVTDHQIKKYEITNFLILPTEEGVEPTLNFSIINSGNVEVRPDRLVYEIQDITDASTTKNGEIKSDDMSFSPPWEKTRQSIRLKETFPIGKYSVNVKFYEKDKVFQSFDNLSYQVVPKGTLNQNAVFDAFSVGNKNFEPNEMIKFDASISSVGEGVIEPILYIEIKTDTKTVDLIKSEKKRLPPGEKANYISTYRLTEVGDYTADAYFEYGFKQTDHKQINFTVGKAEVKEVVTSDVGKKSNIFLIIIIVLVIIAILFIIYYFKFKKSKHNLKIKKTESHKKKVMHRK